MVKVWWLFHRPSYARVDEKEQDFFMDSCKRPLVKQQTSQYHLSHIKICTYINKTFTYFSSFFLTFIVFNYNS